jgi:hypothetical protein
MSQGAMTADVRTQVLFVNIAGGASWKIPSAISKHPNCDIYAFVETMLDMDNCHELQVPGYRTHHCCRARPPRGRGRPHGGITVLLKIECAWLRGTVQVRCDPHAGILWLHLPTAQLTLAFCYFSPSSSSLYSSGVLHPDPVGVLFDGLAAARQDGHRLVIMGDFNVRIGTLSNDVPPPASIVLPPFLSPSDDTFLHAYDGIPASRNSEDQGVPNRAEAVRFLHGVHDAQCVVLNGRAPGDAGGAYTYGEPTTSSGATHATNALSGISAIDLVAVSCSMFASVHEFLVCDFDPSISSDHRAVQLTMQMPMPSVHVRQGIRSRVYRPIGVEQVKAYCDALHAHDEALSDILGGMQHGQLSLDAGLQGIAGIMQRCCGRRPAQRGSRAVLVSSAPRRRRGVDAQWYDDECRLLRSELTSAWSAHLALPSHTDLRVLAVAARKAYKRAVHCKKYQYEQECQIKQLDMFFSKSQRGFWRDFLGKRDAACPVADVGEWTLWFKHIMGSVPEAINLTPSQAEAKDQLHHGHSQDACHAECLNEPIELDEVALILQGLPAGKSADVMGLTCELLKLAAVRVDRHATVAASDVGNEGHPPPPPPHPPEHLPDTSDYVSEPLIKCMSWVLGHMGGQIPLMLQTSKLTPVRKSRAGADSQWDKNMYRGISVSSIFVRVLDRLMHTRMDKFVEARSLRAPTQCGFRKGHGTLDALFTLQHCIKRARWRRQRMYAVFVDFRKAFDTVRRDLMIDRCRQLGVHGQFLTSLLLLYDKVTQRVVVNGVVGEPFSTHVGTKQGSELSPLLFGVFIDMLHELIRLQVPGAGPVLGSIRVSDLIYADDVVLIAMDDPAQAQHLLDCLDLFCAIFGMEVNTDPRKTCVVVFRDPRSRAPADVLTFRGVVVPFRDSYDYLGLVVHATKGLLGAVAALAVAGNRALQTLQSRCRQQRLTQFDLKCRLFDALVEPILSYGSHVWGPEIFACASFRAKPCDNSADKVHMAFLRHMTGCGKSTCIDVLLRDMNRLPLSYRWVLLAARWFMKLRDMQADRLAHNAWVADVELMLDGCRHCWTYKLLDTLSQLGAVPRAMWDHRSSLGVTKEDVMSVSIVEDVVTSALHKCFALRWQGLHNDPRSAPSRQHDKCIHACWVMPPVSSPRGVFGRPAQPKHMKLCMSFKMLQCLARFRVGWHYLESHAARLKRRHGGAIAIVPWGDRKCRLCSVPTGPYYDGQTGSEGGVIRNATEDLRHFMLECPAYCHIRARFPCVFGSADGHAHTVSPCQRMLDIFACHHQHNLAACIYSMDHHRTVCLRRPAESLAAVHGVVAGTILPQAEDDVEMVRLGMMD